MLGLSGLLEGVILGGEVIGDIWECSCLTGLSALGEGVIGIIVAGFSSLGDGTTGDMWGYSALLWLLGELWQSSWPGLSVVEEVVI